jgi:hypothetical protein
VLIWALLRALSPDQRGPQSTPHTCTHVRTLVRAHTHLNTRTHARTHTHTLTHACMQQSSTLHKSNSAANLGDSKQQLQPQQQPQQPQQNVQPSRLSTPGGECVSSSLQPACCLSARTARTTLLLRTQLHTPDEPQKTTRPHTIKLLNCEHAKALTSRAYIMHTHTHPHAGTNAYSTHTLHLLY